MPEVSVIMGVCNGGRYLADSLASLRSQTYPDWELVLVDNGSTDGAVDAAMAEHQDPRVRVLRHEHPLTPGGALEVACRAATGRYLAVLDSDDIALPRRLEIQRLYLDLRPEVCLLGAGSDLIDADGRLLGREPLISRHEDIHAWTAYVHVLRHSTVMFRRELLQHVRYRALGMAADLDFFARAAEVGRVEALPMTLCQYRLHGGNHSRQTHISAANRGLIAMLTHRRRLGLPEDKEKWERVFGDTCARSGGRGGCAYLITAQIFAGEGLHELAACYAWEAMRSGVRWRGLLRYFQAVVRGFCRSRKAARATLRAWLKEPAHQLLRNAGAPDRPQF